MEIYYIGGSPCSGKSTVAEALAQQYGLAYFKADAPGGLQAAGNRTWCTKQHEYDHLMERYGHLMQ